MPIHPTALIDRQAEIDPSADIGPYVVIDGPVRVGARTRVRSHAWLTGWTEIGEDCEIFPFAAIGGLPQDFHHQGERTYCRIGNRVVLREGVTVHRGTQPESATIIGNNCHLMVQSHVGHNTELASGVTLINTAQVAGHVQIGEQVILSGGVLVHQFVRIGALAFAAGNARVTTDVPPFMMCHGEGTVVSVNGVGMRRAHMDAHSIREVRAAYRTLYREGGSFRKAIEELASTVETPAGRQLVEFLQSPSKRGFATGGTHRGRRLGSSPEPELGVD
jgi:UDP-N-acetylglucosamine acyltransferase